MGTNYYIRRHIPQTKLRRIKKLVNEEDIYNGKLNEELEDIKEIHIGKSSMGWKFCFDHNNEKYYEKTQKSVANFIQKSIDEGGSLVDEYGNYITPNNFWELVKSKQDGWTSKEHYEYELQRYNEYCANPETFKDDLFIPTTPPLKNYEIYPEYFSDDDWHLRFAGYTDFC